LNLNGYILICKKFLLISPEGRKGSWDVGIFGWCYTVISWNLIARSITTGEIYMQHISWGNDSLKITVPTTKSDKEEAREFI
jgi:hypothetical protein